MSAPPPNREDEAAIGKLAEAAAWRVRLTEGGAETSAAFEAWLAANPSNRLAWEQVNGPWDLVGEHATTPELMALRRDALHRARRHERRRWAGVSGFARKAVAAVATVAILAGGIGAWVWIVQSPDVYRTALGERRVIPLRDGSRISLDSGSEVRVRYTGDARRLELRAGQARFDVARDVQRPFSVRASDRLVVATGTAFNVDLLGDKLLVTLIEGRVEVLEEPDGAFPARPGQQKNKLQPQVLAAGEQFIATSSSVPVVEKVDIARATAWESGQLVFTDEPLSSVAERISRYTGQPVRVDPEVGQMRISGVFKAGDVETFVDTVSRYLPVSAAPLEDGGLTLRRN